MGFKLGTARQPYAVSGEIRTKLRFDREGGDPNASVPGTPVIRKNLEKDVMGEANMDGSIYISNKLKPGSKVGIVGESHIWDGPLDQDGRPHGVGSSSGITGMQILKAPVPYKSLNAVLCAQGAVGNY